MDKVYFVFHERYAGRLIYKASNGGYVVGEAARYAENPEKFDTPAAARIAIDTSFEKLNSTLAVNKLKTAV